MFVQATSLVSFDDSIALVRYDVLVCYENIGKISKTDQFHWIMAHLPISCYVSYAHSIFLWRHL